MKIGIVNDMPMAVEALRRALALAPEHETIWVASNGEQAVELCASQPPKLVLMDLLMPGVDGAEATRRIMARTPCAILIVTVSIGSNASRVFEAMGNGALDAVDTPPLGAGDPRESAAPLLMKIHTIERMLAGKKGIEPVNRGQLPASAGGENRVIAIGASAGGPSALATVLRGLPKDFRAPIVIVQHVDEQFAFLMADWLSQVSPLPVRVVREGDRPTIGVAMLAATSDHLTLRADGTLGYTAAPKDYVYRPSVDVFFQSLCQFWTGEAVGVLLTGMGHDGAVGLRALRNRGYYTIAQDETSSAVYGMPRAAARLNAAVDIVHIDGVARKLIDASTRKY